MWTACLHAKIRPCTYEAPRFCRSFWNWTDHLWRWTLTPYGIESCTADTSFWITTFKSSSLGRTNICLMRPRSITKVGMLHQLYELGFTLLCILGLCWAAFYYFTLGTCCHFCVAQNYCKELHIICISMCVFLLLLIMSNVHAVFSSVYVDLVLNFTVGVCGHSFCSWA